MHYWTGSNDNMRVVSCLVAFKPQESQQHTVRNCTLKRYMLEPFRIWGLVERKALATLRKQSSREFRCATWGTLFIRCFLVLFHVIYHRKVAYISVLARWKGVDHIMYKLNPCLCWLKRLFNPFPYSGGCCQTGNEPQVKITSRSD